MTAQKSGQVPEQIHILTHVTYKIQNGTSIFAYQHAELVIWPRPTDHLGLYSPELAEYKPCNVKQLNIAKGSASFKEQNQWS